MSSAAWKKKRQARRPKVRVESFRSLLTALVVALSLVFQLVAIPYHQALLASGIAAPDESAIAAELRATFGESASLCVQRDDKGAPASPAGDCDDHCPLCQFAAQATALIAPDAPALPIRLEASCRTLGVAPETGAVPLSPTKRSRARAPPFSV